MILNDKVVSKQGNGLNSGRRQAKGFPSDLVKAARRKLFMLDNAVALDDMKSPPGNKLHALSKDRAGQHAIWINDQFRLCFRWTDAGPEDVEITDYHD
jgi:proteic killer suppression protein